MDTIELFEELDIPVHHDSKNATKGWIMLPCPYPFCHDPSAHMGVNLQTGLHHCWVCGAKGGMERLLHHLLKISYKEAGDILGRLGLMNRPRVQEEMTPRVVHSVKFPSSCTRGLPRLHEEYIKARGFDPVDIQRQFKIRACYKTGYFSYRIVIPVFENEVLMTMTGRDVTGKQKIRYKNYPNDKSLKDTKDCVYNIDSVQHGGKAVILEGPIDVWRIGSGAVSTFGTGYTTEQLIVLLEKEIQEVYVLFDKGARKLSRELAGKLSSFVPSVEELILEKKDPDDPGEMSPAQAAEIQSLLK